jgi:undecaprenyl-diphosphatase
MPPPRRALTLGHAIALGLLEGPTEILPVSSSAHTSLVPLLAGWPYAELDPGLRKCFEVSLHAGAAAALLVHARSERSAAGARLGRGEAAWLALSCAPAAGAGLLFAGPIERRLGGPRVTACALASGALAMALADRRAGVRALADAGQRDALAIGLAQALALVPGVSRNGAALAAARALGFERRAAHQLSWRAGLLVMAGASAFSAARAARRGLPAGAGAPLAAGGAAALCSTLASARLLRRPAQRPRALLRCSLYRLALAALVAARLRGRAAASGTALP